MYVFIYQYVCSSMYVCMYAYGCMYLWMHVCMYCVYIFIDICTEFYVYFNKWRSDRELVCMYKCIMYVCIMYLWMDVNTKEMLLPRYLPMDKIYLASTPASPPLERFSSSTRSYQSSVCSTALYPRFRCSDFATEFLSHLHHLEMLTPPRRLLLI